MNQSKCTLITPVDQLLQQEMAALKAVKVTAVKAGHKRKHVTQSTL